jgi:hypothetical protein
LAAELSVEVPNPARTRGMTPGEIVRLALDSARAALAEAGGD